MSKNKSSRQQKPKEHLIETDSEDDEINEQINDTETSVDVGYIDPDLYPESTHEERKLTKTAMKSPFFTSKIGGRPSWLNFFNLPLAKETVHVTNNNDTSPPVRLECNNCKEQLKFLLQLYAPISDDSKFYDKLESVDEAFHRILYVFICSNKECLPVNSRGIKVYRSQLKLNNDFFSSTPPPALDSSKNEKNQKQADDYLLSHYKNLYEKNLLSNCVICGLLSTKKCAKCSFSHYCSQSHQIFDWTKENHKEVCEGYLHWSTAERDIDELLKLYIEKENAPGAMSDQGLNEHVFPEHEILIEPEIIPASCKKQKQKETYDEEKLALDLESNLAIDQDLDNVEESATDRDFDKFNKRTKDEPTQVVRYDRGGKPLWVTKYEKIKKESAIPNCAHCGSKRIFEFQINPQLLSYLSLDEGTQSNGVDWAGLYVYTCTKSCTAANKQYVEEFIFKQDFVN